MTLPRWHITIKGDTWTDIQTKAEAEYREFFGFDPIGLIYNVEGHAETVTTRDGGGNISYEYTKYAYTADVTQGDIR